jgi:hypothetical protein
MGRSVPPEPRRSDSAPPAEKALWRWAVDQLDDRVLVLPQVALTVPDRGKPRETELDLVLIDPEAGVTVVEVKGGSLSFSGGRWFQNGKEARDPVEQAKRGRSILRTALRRAGIETASLAERWVVATPDCRLDAPGEPVLPDEQLWDSLAAEQLPLLYARTVGELASGEEPLGEERAGLVANYLRGRDREARPTLRASVDLHEEQVRVHTESHRNVLARFNFHPYVLVRGAAGTGKTVLALEAAANAAAWGQRVLLVCWNVVLGRWMQTALRAELEALGSPVADEVTDDPTGRIVVGDVAGLAEGVVGALPDLPLEELYREWLPERFTDLSPGATDGEFDLVVLDEAQDLTEAWVLAVASLVARDGKWFAFSDRQQDLFNSDAALPDFLEVHHELRENFRNSRQIAEFAAAFGDIEMDCVTGDGPPVRFVACDTERVIARTHEVARKLQRDEHIADADLATLFLFHNPNRHHSDELADVALRGEAVCTNGAAFKGMERPVVVLGLDIDPTKTDRADEVRRSIYAAATRARSHLVVVGDPNVADAYGFEGLGRALRAGADTSA